MKGKRVYVCKANEYQPEKSKSIRLKVWQKRISNHFQKAFISRPYLSMKQACTDRRNIFVNVGLKLSHNIRIFINFLTLLMLDSRVSLNL